MTGTYYSIQEYIDDLITKANAKFAATSGLTDTKLAYDEDTL